MGSTFTTDQAQRARYALETLVYTGWPFAGTGGASSLGTGTTSLINATEWNESGKPTWRASVSMVQATQTSNVALTWTADPPDTSSFGFGSQPGPTLALPSGVRQARAKIAAVNTLTLALANTSGAAVASYQGNYGVTMQRLTAVDKLLAQRNGMQGSGWYALTPEEQSAVESLGAVPGHEADWLERQEASGYLPVSADDMKRRLYDNRIVEDAPDLWSVSATSSQAGFASYDARMQTATRGMFPILTELAVEGATNVTVLVNRDNQLGYLSVNGAGFAQTDDAPWSLWIPATTRLSLQSVAGPGNTATTTSANIRVRVAWCSMSEILAVLFGRITARNQLPQPGVYDAAIAGLLTEAA